MSLRRWIYGELLCLLGLVQYSLEDTNRAPLRILIPMIEAGPPFSWVAAAVFFPLFIGVVIIVYAGPVIAIAVTNGARRRGLITRTQQACSLAVFASIWLATIVASLPLVQ